MWERTKNGVRTLVELFTNYAICYVKSINIIISAHVMATVIFEFSMHIKKHWRIDGYIKQSMFLRKKQLEKTLRLDEKKHPLSKVSVQCHIQHNKLIAHFLTRHVEKKCSTNEIIDTFGQPAKKSYILSTWMQWKKTRKTPHFIRFPSLLLIDFSNPCSL